MKGSLIRDGFFVLSNMTEAYNCTASPLTARETDHGTSDRSESKTKKAERIMNVIVYNDGTFFK